MASEKAIQSTLDTNNFERLSLIACDKNLSISNLVRYVLLEYLEQKRDIIKELQLDGTKL
jgi:hypothetical protein